MKQHVFYFSCLFAVLVVFAWPGHLQSADNQTSIATARAIVDDGTLLIDSKYQQEIDARPSSNVEGKVYSRFGIGLALLYIPFVYISHFFSQFADADTVGHLVFSTIPPLFGFLNFALLYGCFRKLGCESQRAILFTFLVSVFTLNLRYTVHDHSEIIQSCFFVGATLLLLQNTRRYLALAFFLIGFTVLIKVYNIAIYGIFALFALWLCIKQRQPLVRSLLSISIPGVLVVTGILLLNYIRFQSLTETGYGDESSHFALSFFLRDALPLLISLEMGYFAFNPLMILAFAGILIGLRKLHPIAALSLLIFGFLWFLSACFWAPKGAWSLGPRYIVPSISMIGLGFAFLDLAKPYLRYSLLLLLLPATYLSTVYVLQKTQEYDVIRFMQAENSNELPPQITGLSKLLLLKANGADQEYPEGAFNGVKSDKVYSLGSYETYKGVNTFYNHALNKVQKPNFILPILILHLVLFALSLASAAYFLLREPSFRLNTAQDKDPGDNC